VSSGGECGWHIVERGHPEQMTDDERKKFLESEK
jgi:hypothetical protein